ncbi:MAG: alpha/beta hydrolase [Chloroflexi bacterium]|nr:alpha/beta hydrolase [Chloroflexota bacterium]
MSDLLSNYLLFRVTIITFQICLKHGYFALGFLINSLNFNNVQIGDKTIMGVTESSLAIPSSIIRYLEAGYGDPLIMLHSWPYCADIFFKNFTDLASRFHVIAPDLPGFGRSRNLLGHYSLRGLTASVHEFIKELGVERTNIIGVSMGGTVALMTASKYPEVVKRVIVHAPIYNPDWFWKNPRFSRLRWIRPFLRFSKGRLLVSWYMKSKLHYRKRLGGLDDRFEERDNAKFREIYNTVRNSSSQAIGDIFLELISSSIEDEIRHVQAPVLVLMGDGDVVSEESMIRLCNDILQTAELKIFNNATHDLIVERYHDFNKLATSFFG